jgi:methanogenic corrinoid protein MtbC1
MDQATAHASGSLTSRLPPRIWRYRPALQSVNVIQAIKTQIIPKIVLALRSSPDPKKSKSAQQKSPGDVQKFAALALENDDDAALAYVKELVENGTSVEQIFLEILAPAARYFGELWESDATDFATVTLAMTRLQRTLRVLAEQTHTNIDNNDNGESALLTTVPGEQHSFGLLMVAEFFRRDGWNLCTGPFASHLELTSLVHNHWFDIVGFSVSSSQKLDELKRDIDDIRKGSRNTGVRIMLGGPMPAAYPELAKSMGADLVSVDAISAPQQARGLISQIKKSA